MFAVFLAGVVFALPVSTSTLPALRSDEVAVGRRIKRKSIAEPVFLPAPAPPQSAKPSTADRLLAAHNKERVRLGIRLLTWSPELARNAQHWAAHLSRTGTFVHATFAKGEADQGENLWMGTRSSYDPEEMVQAWIDERTMFKSGKFPSVSKTGDWRDVGHYTQLIWHKTSAVGCAISANQSDEYLVCRYDPPGNWEGQHPLGQ